MARTSAADRREQFVEAAIRVMSREGLERATTRRIAEEAGTTQGVFHYAFRDKNELLTEVVAAVTAGVEAVLREGIDPRLGLAAALEDGPRAYWAHITSDDGLQLMQYELTIFCRRTEGFEWLAEWQYARYTAVTMEAFAEAASHDSRPPAIDLADLANFVVAGMDGLVMQYEVSHDTERSERTLDQIIRSAIFLAGLKPRERQSATSRRK